MTKKTIYIALSVVIALAIFIGTILWLRSRGTTDDDLIINQVTNTSTLPSTTTSVIPAPVVGIDSDKDGLTDTEELSLGTNPNIFDTDEDGFGDHEEVVTKSDPKNKLSVPGIESRSEPTPSRPAVTTTSEVSDSDLVDSDSDTIPDSAEPLFGTDPKKADTDGDTFPDADEIKNGYNPLGTGKCAVTTCLIN